MGPERTHRGRRVDSTPDEGEGNPYAERKVLFHRLHYRHGVLRSAEDQVRSSRRSLRYTFHTNPVHLP